LQTSAELRSGFASSLTTGLERDEIGPNHRALRSRSRMTFARARSAFIASEDRTTPVGLQPDACFSGSCSRSATGEWCSLSFDQRDLKALPHRSISS
jgi:hypothetical protein